MIQRQVEIPDGVTVAVEGKKVTVKGPEGELKRDFSSPVYEKTVSIEKKGSSVLVSSSDDKKKYRALIGTIAVHIKNMITGVEKGYEYVMKIHYVHFPMNVEAKENKIYIKNFLGEKGARTAKIVKGCKVEIMKDEIKLTSPDKEAAGQTAANIEQACKVKKRDRRIFQDGIFIVKKAGE